MLAAYKEYITDTIWQHTQVEKFNSSAARQAMEAYGRYWGPYLP